MPREKIQNPRSASSASRVSGTVRWRWRSWVAGKWPVLRFGLKFAGFVVMFHALKLLPLYSSVLTRYLEATALLANSLVHLVGENSQLAGASIWSARYSVTVSDACSALELVWFLGAAMLAFPASWSRKIAGLAASLLLLGLLNVLRIASLYLCGLHGWKAVDVIHQDAWPALLVMATVAAMAGWIAWVHQPRHIPSHAAA